MRNPFRIQASQRSTSDDEFVRLFGAGALDVVQSVHNPWESLVFLRGAPGGGKTTFLRILTPRPLKLADVLAETSQGVKATRDALRTTGALDAEGPRLLGAMVVFTTEYRELGPFDRGNALFRELLNSRIVVATLRSVVERAERMFPDDLGRFTFEWHPESGATIPTKATGDELFEWASRIERGFYERMDELGAPSEVKGGHARLDGLRWFAHVRIAGDRGPMETKRVLLMDELQVLTPGQREGLVKFVTDAREGCGIWIAERLEALTHRDLLSEGALRERDYGDVIHLERRWSGTRSKAYGRFVEQIANLRAAKADGFEGRELFPLIAETDDIPALEDALSAKCAEIEAALLGASGGRRYASWIEAARAAPGDPMDRATRWRLLQILVARDMRKRQTAFDFEILGMDEFGDRAGSGTDRAAEHFLRTEVGAPIYFGREALSAVSSSNVDQYLDVLGALFEEISAKIRFRRDQPTPLSAARQDALVREVAKERWEGLIRRLPQGIEARRLLEAIGEYCRGQTFRPNAPYAPGVTGIAITMADRKTLIEGEGREIGPFLKLRDVMTSLVAHNLLVPMLDRRNNGREVVVFYLNRLLCVRFGLPLGFGGWRAQTLRDLVAWHEGGAKAVPAVRDDAKLI